MPLFIKQTGFLRRDIQSDYFWLHVNRTPSQSTIDMQLLTETLYSGEIPDTIPLLKRFLPTVLGTECFNEQNIPFSEEAVDTEMGHLFEHVLLEYLCQYTIFDGKDEALFRGFTDWNWRRDPYGLFHITVYAKSCSELVFYSALNKSIQFFTTLLENKPVRYNHVHLFPHFSITNRD